MKIIIIMALVLSVLTGCVTEVPVESETTKGLQVQCKQLEGIWIDTAQECEGIGKDACDSMGGQFNECASACRNDPDAQICTMQCVLVCEFNEVNSETQEIPVDCTSWFDGCNTCMVKDGQLGGCTKMHCETYEEPKCLE